MKLENDPLPELAAIGNLIAKNVSIGPALEGQWLEITIKARVRRVHDEINVCDMSLVVAPLPD